MLPIATRTHHPSAHSDSPRTHACASQETDSVFLGAPDELTLRTGRKSDVEIMQQGWNDAVVWNPWDSMPDSYPHFVCVECAKVGTPEKLAPGESWTSTMTLSAA